MSRNLFTEHPASVGETYGEHLQVAGGFGLRMILGGMACLLHGLLPFLFTRTGSRTIALLHERMVISRRRGAVPPQGLAAPPPSDLPLGLKETAG